MLDSAVKVSVDIAITWLTGRGSSARYCNEGFRKKYQTLLRIDAVVGNILLQILQRNGCGRV